MLKLHVCSWLRLINSLKNLFLKKCLLLFKLFSFWMNKAYLHFKKWINELFYISAIEQKHFMLVYEYLQYNLSMWMNKAYSYFSSIILKISFVFIHSQKYLFICWMNKADSNFRKILWKIHMFSWIRLIHLPKRLCHTNE